MKIQCACSTSQWRRSWSRQGWEQEGRCTKQRQCWRSPAWSEQGLYSSQNILHCISCRYELNHFCLKLTWKVKAVRPTTTAAVRKNALWEIQMWSKLTLCFTLFSFEFIPWKIWYVKLICYTWTTTAWSKKVTRTPTVYAWMDFESFSSGWYRKQEGTIPQPPWKRQEGWGWWESPCASRGGQPGGPWREGRQGRASKNCLGLPPSLRAWTAIRHLWQNGHNRSIKVRLQVPIMVVMVSWTARRPYTFLMNPAKQSFSNYRFSNVVLFYLVWRAC